MTAFVHANAPSAIRIISDDDIIDAMYNTLYSELMDFMIRSLRDMERAIHVETGESGDMVFSKIGFSK
jgi:phosphate uptake regulator